MICSMCHVNKGVYNVVSPLCLNSVTVKVCPACFQRGIDMKEIVWIGDKPFGICAECLEKSA